VKKASFAAAAVLAAVALVSCGSSETKTITEEAQSGAAENSAKLEALQLEKETAEAEAEAARASAEKETAETGRSTTTHVRHEPEPEPEEVPDVVGMRLPEATSTLGAAGYRTKAENTDTLFGIVVPSHYTVCEQSEPHGNVVDVLAQKYGC
jgi:beta-lactam-binding protein with PASTA domain